jgi:hypothetical protein
MIGQELRQLQQALDQKADAVQHNFLVASDDLNSVTHLLTKAEGEQHDALLVEQAALRHKQEALADEINLWRDRARAVMRQPSDAALLSLLKEIAAANDESVRPAVERVRHLLKLTTDELDQLRQSQVRAGPATFAGRLIERARTELDLRGVPPAARQQAAFEFANRPGLAQNDQALAELEAALTDDDPMVQEVAALTLIQIHRFRALNLGDLEAALASVQRLARLRNPAVVPVFIEILQTPRTGYVTGPAGLQSGNNRRVRELALSCLADWHTPQAQSAVRAAQNDRDPEIAQDATHLLEWFPGEWR